MFEAHMDEYLDEEIEWVKHAFDAICKGWDQEVSLFAILCRSEGRDLHLCFIDIDIIAYSNYGIYAVPGFAQSGLGETQCSCVLHQFVVASSNDCPANGRCG